MSLSTVFASPTLQPLSRSLIAALFYDIATPDPDRAFDIPAAMVEDFFHTAFEAAAQGIIRSERTRGKLLRSLQRKDSARVIEKFRRDGEPVPGDYFEQCFASVISRANADKIVPGFLAALRHKIAENPDLLKKLVQGYQEGLKTSGSEGGTVFSEAFCLLLKEFAEELPLEKKTNGMHAEPIAREERPIDPGTLASAALDRRDTQEDGLFEAVFPHHIHSGQMVFWEPHRHTLPVRGLRHLEPLLDEHPLLCVTGNAGCGKSMLISAFLYQQVQNQALRTPEVFYYRFVKDISTYETFLQSLAKFLELEFWEEPTGQEDFLAAMLARTDRFFVLDDLHVQTDRRFRGFLERCWQNIQTGEEFAGKLIIVSRSRPDFPGLQDAQVYHYEGLAISESNALLRDLWRLPLPRMIARQLAQKLGGNPERMQLFRNWLLTEHHTDTELERFVAQMPSSDGSPEEEQQLTHWVAEHLWAVFEQVDSRFNSFLKVASIFTVPEEEGFFEKIYTKIGGGDFQNKLEDLVEKYDMLVYDEQVGRYKVPDNFRAYYYEKLDNLQIRRSLHKAAAQQYQDRFQTAQRAVDALLGAEHFFRAERDDRALQLLEPVLSGKTLPAAFSDRLLVLLKSAELGVLESAEVKGKVLFSRGRLYFQNNKMKPAEKDLGAAEKMQPAPSILAEILYYLALIASAKGQTERAVQRLTESREIFTRLNDLEGVARTTSRLADVYLVSEKLKAAEECYARARTLYEQMADRRSELYTVNQLAAIARARNQWEPAYEYYQQALAISDVLRDPAENALALSNLGQVHEIRQQWDAAIAAYQQEIEVRQSVNDRVGGARAKEKIGRIYHWQGDTRQAFECFEAARTVYENRQDKPGQASVYKHLGLIYFARGEWEVAMEHYHRSLEVLEQLNDQNGLGQIYTCIARAYRRIGEYERALDMLDKALEIRERLANSPGVAEIYEEIGDIYCDREQPDYALEVYERAISMKENLRDLSGMGDIYYKIGEMHRGRDSGEFAERSYHLALDYYKKAQNLAGLAKTCRTLGVYYHTSQNGERAIEYFQQAIGYLAEMGDVATAAAATFQLGNVHYDLGDWQRALEQYQNALPLFEQTGDLFSIAQVMGNTSSIEFEQQEHAAAIRKQVEILLFFESRQEAELMDKVLTNLVACHQKLGADVFQPLLNACLERITREGVHWGHHRVIDPPRAAEMVQRIFYNV